MAQTDWIRQCYNPNPVPNPNPLVGDIQVFITEVLCPNCGPVNWSPGRMSLASMPLQNIPPNGQNIPDNLFNGYCSPNHGGGDEDGDDNGDEGDGGDNGDDDGDEGDEGDDVARST